MKYIYMALIVVLLLVIAVFALQNLQVVTVSFLHMSITLPLALMILVVYLLGMFTGGFIMAQLWGLVRGAGR